MQIREIQNRKLQGLPDFISVIACSPTLGHTLGFLPWAPNLDPSLGSIEGVYLCIHISSKIPLSSLKYFTLDKYGASFCMNQHYSMGFLELQVLFYCFSPFPYLLGHGNQAMLIFRAFCFVVSVLI